MTGFGEASLEFETGNCTIRVQAKSVNNRFIDTAVRLPALYSSFEADVQKKIKEKLKRGRVEISAYRTTSSGPTNSTINAATLSDLMNQMEALEIKGVTKKDLLLASLPVMLSRKEVYEGIGSEQVSEEEKRVFLSVVDSALDSLVASRKLEGKALFSELLLQIDRLKVISVKVEGFSKDAPQKLKQKIELRIRELMDGNSISTSLSTDRLEQEVAILADKIDIREEIVRLNSHIELFNSSMIEGGRKLEFVLQEMGREVNTIGSKSNEAEVSTLVIESKSILEKLREQVQNVE